MAKINTPRKKKAPARRAATGPALPLRARVKLWLVRGIGGIGAGLLLWIIAYGFLNPPITPYMIGERRILGDIEREWVPTERISPMLLRSVVAAEDANFCSHWGFDVAAIRSAIEVAPSSQLFRLPLQVELIRGLKEAVRGDLKSRLIVTADANSSHQSVVRAMDAAGQVGLSRISITTQNPDDES